MPSAVKQATALDRGHRVGHAKQRLEETVQPGEREGRLGLTARCVDNAVRRSLSGLLRGKQAGRFADPVFTDKENGFALVTGWRERGCQNRERRLAADQAIRRPSALPVRPCPPWFTFTVERTAHRGFCHLTVRGDWACGRTAGPAGRRSSPGRRSRARQERRELAA